MSGQEEQTETTSRSRREEPDAFNARFAEHRRTLERRKKEFWALIEFAESDQRKHLFSRRVIEAAKRVVRKSAADGKDAP